MQHEKNEFGLGVIGMGGFGLFASQHFLQIPGTRLVAIAGTNREGAKAAAERFGAVLLDSLDELVAHPDVSIVYIATPPFLHYQQALLALQAGKHVICEKPLAVTAEQGHELIRLAAAKKLLMITNLMQRYNPMFERVRQLIDNQLLGLPLHGYFENYAADEGLSAGHWFWDRSKSGGIFIEHGVHFFDLFAGWLGHGEVVAAQSVKRPGTDIEEQVNCTVVYDGGVTVNFYHGFTQPGRMDRQEMRILFERGDITLHEWVPTRINIRCLADEATTRALMDLFPGARLDVSASYGGSDRNARGRHKDMDVWQQVEISYGYDQHKMHLYGELLRQMFREQTAYLLNPETHRKITEENGLQSLLTAIEASRLARR
ncbi:Gfo/Idh/MocA family protein [Arsenicibacter rosenii]|uniref:Dehydrogenase n=1 Tax=Arsenicibacter rosenii TaxID=1750698 RepID=A0A1S2VHK7_9BACT|nr:Gfo/Idh/MocA family oxidoreductase [Arsenicibacter rosenii]OIN57696.1 dehydrogenase [Arsenicibacter rosenii]